MKHKTYNIIGGCAVLLVALFMVLSRNALTVPKASAAASGAPTISLTPTYDSGTNNVIGESISISSPGPFTQDFRYQVCWTPIDNNGGAQTTCVWSPWAASSVNSIAIGGAWSQWMWPGFKDEMKHGSGFPNQPSDVWVNAVATQPLPAGTELVNVQVGIDLAEANGGMSGSTPQCSAVETPYGGGMSRAE